MKDVRRWPLAVLMTGVIACAAALCFGRETTALPYAYHSPAFTRFVADSDHAAGAGTPQAFYAWMDHAFPGRGKGSLTALLDRKGRGLDRIADPVRKTRQELALAVWVHHAVKTMLPKFSFDQGFEFTNAVRRGERQCLLQSVLTAGLLQRMGMDAGTVMVWRSNRGQTSNNGHAVALLKLPDGRDILVDCSDPQPFVRHLGLFAAIAGTGGYQFVVPVYAGNSPYITAYAAAAGAPKIPAARVRGLDVAFLRSQFDYYRGERTAGGLLAPRRTPAGLAAEAHHLQASIQACPQNPLAVYMLGRVYLKQGKLAPAQQQLQVAKSLYTRFGWVPPGVRDAFAEAKL